MPNNIQIQIVGDALLAENVKQTQEIYENVKATYDVWQKISKSKSSGDQMDKTIEDLKNLVDESKKYNKAVEDLIKNTKDYDNILSKNITLSKLQTKNLSELGTEIEKIKKDNKELSKNYAENSQKISENKLKIKELSTEYRTLEKNILSEAQSLKVIDELNGKDNLTLQQKRELLSALKFQVSQLNTEYDAMTPAQQQLIQQTNKLNTEVKQAEERYGVFTRSVGDYKKALSELLIKEQQIIVTSGKESAEYKQLQIEIEQTTAAIKQQTIANTALQARTNELLTAQNKQTAGLKTMFAGFASFNVATTILQTATKAFQYLKEEMKNVIDIQDKLRTNIGSTGQELDDQTVKVQALTKTFSDVDTTELVDSFDYLNRIFPENTNNLELLGNALQSAANRTEFLSTLQIGAEELKNFGLNAEQTINVLAQGFNDDIFNEKAFTTINKAQGALAEMSDKTKNLLTDLGLTSEEINSAIESGSTTSFEFIQKISGKISELEPNSVAATNAIKGIFGKGAAELGANYFEMLSNVNIETNKVDNSVSNLTKSKLKLNEAIAQLTVSLTSTEGEFSNIMTVLNNLGADILTAVMNSESLKNVFTSLFDVFKDLFDSVQGIFEIFGDAGDGISVFSGIIDVLTVTTNIALAPLKLLIKIVTGILNVFTWLTNKLIDSVATIKEFIKGNDTLSKIFELLQPIIDKITAGFVGLKNAVVDVLQWLGIIKDDVGPSLGTIADTSAETAKTVQENEKATTELTTEELATRQQAYQDYLKAINDLERLRIETLKEGREKAIATEELAAKELREQYAGNLKALEYIEIAHNQAILDINKEYDLSELQLQNETLEAALIAQKANDADIYNAKLTGLQLELKLLDSSSKKYFEKIQEINELVLAETERLNDEKQKLFEENQELELSNFETQLSGIENNEETKNQILKDYAIEGLTEVDNIKEVATKKFQIKQLTDEIAYLKEYYGVTTNTEIQLLENKIKILNNEIAGIADETSEDATNSFLKALGFDEKGIELLSENLSKAYDLTKSFLEENINAKQKQIEEKQTLIDKEIEIENQLLENLQTKAEKEKALLEEGKSNEYLYTLTLEAQAQQRIRGKKAEQNELLKLAQDNEKKLKAIKKAEIWTQFAVDSASAISSLIKYSEGNPLNLFTSGLAGIAQLAAGLIRIGANFAFARSQVKNLAEGEILIQGVGTETSDSIPLMVSKNESVINARNSKRAPNFLTKLNKDANLQQLQQALIADFGQDILKNYNIEVGFDSYELKIQNENLKHQIKKLEKSNDLLEKIVNLTENSGQFLGTPDNYVFISKNLKRRVKKS